MFSTYSIISATSLALGLLFLIVYFLYDSIESKCSKKKSTPSDTNGQDKDNEMDSGTDISHKKEGNTELEGLYDEVDQTKTNQTNVNDDKDDVYDTLSHYKRGDQNNSTGDQNHIYGTDSGTDISPKKARKMPEDLYTKVKRKTDDKPDEKPTEASPSFELARSPKGFEYKEGVYKNDDGLDYIQVQIAKPKNEESYLDSKNSMNKHADLVKLKKGEKFYKANKKYKSRDIEINEGDLVIANENLSNGKTYVQKVKSGDNKKNEGKVPSKFLDPLSSDLEETDN